MSLRRDAACSTISASMKLRPVLEMRTDLMAALRKHIEKRGWTQSEAAKKLGITRPTTSALMKGAWRDFSADMLLVLAVRLGLRATLKLAA
jgi:predicted XRE-type DNA-binding protein